MFENGLVYKGEYKNDLKVNGVLIDFKTQKIVYEGGWENDLYSGTGKLDRLNG